MSLIRPFEMQALSDECPLIEGEVYEGEPDVTMLRSYGRIIYWVKYSTATASAICFF